jgi:hypothetical protein
VKSHEELGISLGALLYLLVRLRAIAMHEYPTGIYNYYDGFQEFTHELAGKGFAHVGESMGDEVALITRKGYLALRSREWFWWTDLDKLDKAFHVSDEDDDVIHTINRRDREYLDRKAGEH